MPVGVVMIKKDWDWDKVPDHKKQLVLKTWATRQLSADPRNKRGRDKSRLPYIILLIVVIVTAAAAFGGKQ